MMKPIDDQVYDIEKDSGSVSTEEASHSQTTHQEEGKPVESVRRGSGSRYSYSLCWVCILAVLGSGLALILLLAFSSKGCGTKYYKNDASRAANDNEKKNLLVPSPQEEPMDPFDIGPIPSNPQETITPSEAGENNEALPVTYPPKPVDPDQCPGHLDGDYYEVSFISAFQLELGEPGSAEARTFEVELSHQILDNGVVFNVETVTEALSEDLAKPVLTAPEIQAAIQEEASKFYQEVIHLSVPNVTLEVMSKDDLPLVFAGNQGFLVACMMAFAQHLPLALTPDHIWTVIVQGFARHVQENAEALRDHFVAFEDKKEIKIREDRMVKGGSPPEQWEALIFPRFSEEIGKNMNNTEAYETLSKKVFSTSTSVSQAASEIVLMAAMKQFFEFTMITSCGIPQVRLEGTRDDWVALRERSKKLARWMMPNTTNGELWITDIVLPILDKMVDAYDGEVDYCFWQNMVKFRTTGGGSGSFEFLSGWLPTLFPYLTYDGEIRANPFLRHWEESASAQKKGPRPSQIPTQIASVPVQWEYFDFKFPIHFHAGFRGVTQEADGTLSPVLGWYVSNDPELEI